MIKQLFKQNVLFTTTMAVLLMLFASGYNDILAQSASTAASSAGLSETELREFKTDLLVLIDDAETNPLYGQVERAIRLNLYDDIRKNVVNGAAVEKAIDASVISTVEFANEEYPTHTVDIKQLGEDTKNQLL